MAARSEPEMGREEHEGGETSAEFIGAFLLIVVIVGTVAFVNGFGWRLAVLFLAVIVLLAFLAAAFNGIAAYLRKRRAGIRRRGASFEEVIQARSRGRDEAE